MAVEEFLFRRQPENGDAVGEEDRHRRGKAQKGEVVVAADGVIG